MRREIKIMGLALLAALSVMAVTAVAAQAESQFRVEGKVLKEGEEAVLEGTGGASKFTVPSLGLTIECNSVLLEAHVTNTPFHAHSKHHWMRHFCFIEGLEEACTIYPTKEDLTKKTFGGLLLSLNLFLIGLFGGSHYWLYVLVETFYFGGAECPFGELVAELKGESAVKFGTATTEATSHTMEDVTAKEEKELKLPGVTFNGEPAEMSGGNTTVKLVGALAGKKFSLN